MTGSFRTQDVLRRLRDITNTFVSSFALECESSAHFLFCFDYSVSAYSQRAEIRITPSRLRLTPDTVHSGGTVEVVCRPPPITSRVTSAMQILKAFNSNPNANATILAHFQSLLPNELSASSTDERIEVTGNSSVLVLKMTAVKCGDGGIFICFLRQQDPDGPSEYKSTANLTVTGKSTKVDP